MSDATPPPPPPPPTELEKKRYGTEYFISFYATVLSRLAYFSDHLFIMKYSHIFGPIIPEFLLSILNDLPSIQQLLNSKAIQAKVRDMIKTKTADIAYENDVLVSNLSKNDSKVVFICHFKFFICDCS